MLQHPRRPISLVVSFLTILLTSTLYAISPTITETEKNNNTHLQEEETREPKSGRYVVVNLNTNTVTLHDDTHTNITMTMVSQGKPGSYYETIGGEYTSDYKIPLHFSSIGLVYMPFSVHLFGNYFIHGIPYYPDGTKVSSAYSGGCVRLNDADAKQVYNFITATTSIIITRGNEHDFTPTKNSSTTISSLLMTRLMVATISLELLTQENEIPGFGGQKTITRKEILPLLFSPKNIDARILYAGNISDTAFIKAMNNKAKSLGLTNTMFTGVNTPTNTTKEDYGRFMRHIDTYKSYLWGI